MQLGMDAERGAKEGVCLARDSVESEAGVDALCDIIGSAARMSVGVMGADPGRMRVCTCQARHSVATSPGESTRRDTSARCERGVLCEAGSAARITLGRETGAALPCARPVRITLGRETGAALRKRLKAAKSPEELTSEVT
eukprot:999146-Pleurochrysis_carterae.AAC.1